MAIYYFSGIQSGDDVAGDDEGLVFDSIEEACLAADGALREMAAGTPLATKTLWMTVLDESRKVVHRAHLDIVSDTC